MYIIISLSYDFSLDDHDGNDDDNDVSGSQIMSTPKLKELVQFICGHPHLPKVGQLIQVRFTRSSLPDPKSCFNIIKLPFGSPRLQCLQEGNACSYQLPAQRLWPWLKR